MAIGRTGMLLGAAAAVAVGGGGGWFVLEQRKAERQAERVQDAQLAMRSVSAFVAPGTPVDAKSYYTRIQTKLGLTLLDQAGEPARQLDALIAHFGYPGLVASRLEALEPNVLMPKDQPGFDALEAALGAPVGAGVTLATYGPAVRVSRFFAPKIVDYTGPAPYKPGFRKLVKLDAQPGSPAAAAGMASLYLLFNYVAEPATADPFAGAISKNNQVIIVPKTVGPNEDSAYFLVFLQAPEYRLGLALQGVAFDLPGPRDYFVPTACAQCHGHDQRSGQGSPAPPDGIFRSVRLNYLDTDQWHDAKVFDFSASGSAMVQPVIFDGGPDSSTPAYKAAMQVLRELNQGIEAQNAAINPADEKVVAVRKWIEVHATRDGPVPMDERVLQVAGGQVWNTSNAEEKELLGHLNHYCFRCHSSVRYSVFDREGVANASAGFENRLTVPPTNARYMPQGRVLPAADRDRIIELSNKLFGG